MASQSRCVLSAMMLLALIESSSADDAAELATQARAQLAGGNLDQAAALADRAVAADKANSTALLTRADVRAARREFALADEDFTAAMQLAPRQAEIVDRRGSARLALGKIDEALADFDRFLEQAPAAGPHHWKRGIALYYAGRYDDGRKQFERYQTVDDNDVENVVWRFLCMAKGSGLETARKELLPVKHDGRIPLMEIHALFAGRSTVDAVMAAAAAGNPTAVERNERLFYANLYLGLFHDATGKPDQAARHLRDAVEKHALKHYMWDIAGVHLRRLEK